MNKIKTIFAIALLSMLFGMNATAEGTLADAFKNGTVKGKATVYYEVHDRDSEDVGAGKSTGDSFAVGALSLGYKTAKWNNLQLGVTAFAASQLYDHDGEFDGDFEGDDNTPAALSEIYLKYYFTEKSYVLAGRFSHKKVSKIDDVQSQGAYIQFNDVENLTVNAGFITEFAELDYDDYEDFGNPDDDNKQDLSSDAFGAESDDFMVFADVTYDLSDNVSINPFVYFQGDYATVFGFNTELSAKLNDDVKVGLDTAVYGVQDERQNSSDDSEVFFASPWVKFGGIKLFVGAGQFDGGFYKPRWFKDYVTGFDQENDYGSTDEATTVVQAGAEYKYENFKVRYGIQQWNESGDNGAETLEQELIVGYKFSKALDAELRFFHEDGENGSDVADDYQKIEARLRYKF